MNCGIFCMGALGVYALMMHASARATPIEGVEDPNAEFRAATERPTIIGRISPETNQIDFERRIASNVIQIDREEYCKQVATAVLVRYNHRITDEDILFIRDPRLPGNAIQQFSRAFGYAIETGLGTEIPRSEP